MSDNRIPRQIEDYRLEEMDGEMLLHHPGQTQTLYLNETAAIIWQLCDGQRNVGEIVELLKENFPKVAGTIEGDVMETLEQIKEFGGIEYLPS